MAGNTLNKLYDYVPEKIADNIEKAERIFGKGTSLVIIDFVVWDYEVEEFLDYTERMAKEHAVDNHQYP